MKIQINNKENQKSQVEILMEIASNLQLFHDKNESYAVIIHNSIRQAIPLRHTNFKLWLRHQYYNSTGKTPSTQAVKEALETLESKALFEGERHTLHNRVHFADDTIWYDLSSKQYESVKITKDGWEIVNSFTPIFKRYDHQSEQATPIQNGNLYKLLDYVNIKPTQRLLFNVYVVSCFLYSFPHPVLLLHGGKGSSKTTTFKLLKKLIDPSMMDAISFPNKKDDLIQIFQHHWWIGFDNLTKVSHETSDTLCKAVTGDSVSKRKLYTDSEDVIYNFRRCIALNGINIVAEREDLLDRCILFELGEISSAKRKEERILWDNFQKDLPYILGGIFNTLVKALKIYPSVQLHELYRMADFTRWGYAIAEALGEGLGEEFLNQYQQNMNLQNEEAVKANPVATAIVSLLKRHEGSWYGKPNQLLNELESISRYEKLDHFPTSANTLTRELNCIKSNLKNAGITYVNERISSTNTAFISLFTEKSSITRMPIFINPEQYRKYLRLLEEKE